MVLVRHVQEGNAVRIYRIQGSDGRGPFRPGLTEKWIGEPRWDERPSIMEEFDMAKVIAKVGNRHMGCGFRTTDQLRTWFDVNERSKLARMGFHIVTMTVDEIVAESPIQLVFARKIPLRIGAIVISG
jgi:hypothetical protein